MAAKMRYEYIPMEDVMKKIRSFGTAEAIFPAVQEIYGFFNFAKSGIKKL